MMSESLRSFFKGNYVKSTVGNCKNHDQKHTTQKNYTLYLFMYVHYLGK